MSELNLAGLGVALVTPFKNDFSIDYEGLEKLIELVINGGSDYLVVLGTTAETPTLSPQEKDEVAKFVKKKVNYRLPLVIGIGGNNTFGVVREILSRDLEGYEAILSVVPYYNKPTQDGIFQHFKYICDATPLPILLYNVPGRTGVNMSALTTIKLAKYSSKFTGIKEASGKIDQIKEILEGSPSHFQVISGNDGDTAEIMRLGGKGVISVLANAYPGEMKKIIDFCNNGEYVKAQRHQQTLNSFINHLFEDGNPAGVKAVLAKLGLMENILRLPLLPVSRNVRYKLYHDIELLFSND